MRKYFWPAFLLLTFLVRAVLRQQPTWTETVYSRGVFTIIRHLFDLLTGWLPFPAVYLLFGVVGWRLALGIRYVFREKQTPVKQRFWKTTRRLFHFVCGTIALFYWLWGFNYTRIPLEKQLELPEMTINADTLKALLLLQTQTVLDLRQQIQPDSTKTIPEFTETDQMEPAVRQCVINQLNTWGIPTPGRVRGRQPFWDGFLLRFGASGIYNPFTGESNMDHALYFLSKPYVLAHEFGHGYGFGDEGVCNFIGYVSLAGSDNIQLRYSAELGFWRELGAAYRRVDPVFYQTFRANLPKGFLDDLTLIYQRLDNYPEYFSAFRQVAYDQYLKAQGIDEGMKNYDKVIGLVLRWRKIEYRTPNKEHRTRNN